MTRSSFGDFITVVIGLLIFSGWLVNIVKLAQADSFTGFEALRAIGVLFFPVGALLGFF